MPRPSFAPLLGEARVIPVLAIDHLEDAVPLARALHAGGLGVIEVTLRTPVALAACAAIAKECRRSCWASARFSRPIR